FSAGLSAFSLRLTFWARSLQTIFGSSTSFNFLQAESAAGATGSEVSTLVNEGQLARNRQYLSAIVDIIEFLVSHQQPLRGTLDAVESREHHLRSDSEFQAIWAQWQIRTSSSSTNEESLPSPYTPEAVCGGEYYSQLVEALCGLDPENPHFLDVQKVTPLLELTKTTLVESEFAVARNCLQSEMARSTGDVWTPTSILQRFSRPLAAMPTVLTAMKHGVTFGTSSAT
ncbi:hypothetical protein KUCAC02_016474, partial [Chaenocephalus aceratus]